MNNIVSVEPKTLESIASTYRSAVSDIETSDTTVPAILDDPQAATISFGEAAATILILLDSVFTSAGGVSEGMDATQEVLDKAADKYRDTDLKAGQDIASVEDAFQEDD